VQRFLCWSFLAFGQLCGVFHGVGVVVVGFGCFSVVGVVLQGLIVATSAGSGLQQQQQQLLFSAGDLSWFFQKDLFARFLKSQRKGSVATSNNRAHQQT
jgi:hypothetical protein